MPQLSEYPSNHHLSFRRTALRGMGLFLFRWSLLWVVLLMCLTALAVWSARRLDVEANLSAFVPRSSEENSAWSIIGLVRQPYSPVYALVELETVSMLGDLDFDKVAGILEEAWLDPEYILAVQRLDPGQPVFLLPGVEESARFLSLRDAEYLKSLESDEGAASALKALLGDESKSQNPIAVHPEDPLGFFRELALRKENSLRRSDIPPWLLAQPPAREGRVRLLFRLETANEDSEILFSMQLQRFLVQTAEALKRLHPRVFAAASFSYQGRHIDTANLALLLRDDLLRSAIILTLCLFLLLVLSFRKIESIFFVCLPASVGVLWTLGILSLFLPTISILTVAFILLLLLPGLEYAVQIYHRFMEELYKERDYRVALSLAYTEAGRGILVSSLVICLVFLSLYLSSFQNLRELALAGSVGIFCVTAAVLCVFPAMAAFKFRLARGRIIPIELYGFGMKSLSAIISTSPRALLVLLLMITACLAHYSGKTAIKRELGLNLALQPKKLLDQSGIAEARGFADCPLSVLVEADSLQKALEVNDQLFANLLAPPLSLAAEEIDSISPVLPSLARQSLTREAFLKVNLNNIDRALRKAIRAQQGRDIQTEAFIRRLRSMQRQVRSLQPLEYPAALEPAEVQWVQERLVRHGGRAFVLTGIDPQSQAARKTINDFPVFEARASDGITSAILRYDGEAYQNHRVAEAVLYSMAVTVILTIASLLICLLPHFRWRFYQVLLASLPLVCAMVWTLGILAILQFPIGLYTLLVFPFLVGIGLNQSIFLIQRLSERRYASPRQALRSGGRAGIISALTLIITLGCLAQTGYDPLQETALVSVAAIVFSSIITLVFIPALLQIRQEGGLAAWHSGEED